MDIEPLVIDRGPFFDKSASTNVTALVGKTAKLKCRVRNLQNRTVSTQFLQICILEKLFFLCASKMK